MPMAESVRASRANIRQITIAALRSRTLCVTRSGMDFTSKSGNWGSACPSASRGADARLRIVGRRLDHHVHGARRRLLVVPVHLAALAGVRQFQGPYGAHEADHRVQSDLGFDSAVDVSTHRLTGRKVFPCQELVHDYDLLGVRRIALAEVASGAQRYFHGR